MSRQIKVFSLLTIFLFMSACAIDRFAHLIPEKKPPSPSFKEIKIALVLGGGGAKVFSHLGVIEVLEQNNIPLDLIVGASAGASVGALYADSKDSKILKEKLFATQRSDILDLSILDGLGGVFSLSGAVSGNKMQQFFYQNLTAKNFAELKIPLVAVAVDIETNSDYILDSGPIPPAVVASSAIPGIFTPVKMYGHTLVDGGAIYPVPVEIARRYNPKIVIAVDICSPPDLSMPRNITSLSYRAYWMSYHKLCRMQANEADIAIIPDTYGLGIFEDHKREEMYLRGREAAILALPKIKELLQKNTLR